MLKEELARVEREKSAAEAKVDVLRQATLHKDGSGALLTNTRGIEVRGSVASLISVEPGWENAVSAALGSLANALVVHDATHAISALSFLKSESAGSAELLFVDGIDFHESSQQDSVGTPLLSKVSSSTLSAVLPRLLANFVATETLADAEQAIQNNPSVIAVTRDGDLVGRGRASGGSTSRFS